MKVLLTGREGQIGGRLGRLLPGFCDCWSVARDDFDLGDVSALHAALEQFKPALIINAAAYTDVDGAEDHKEMAFALNAKAPKVMADWAMTNSAALIHYSSDYVYDGTGEEPWTEVDTPNPVNAYGESKLAGDRAIAESGAAHLILRTSWIYAAEGRNFLRTMLRLGAEREELSVVDDQIGAPTPASVVASVTAEILNQSKGDIVELFRRKGGVIHCAAMGETSWRGFAESIFKGACKRGAELRVKHLNGISTREYPRPARRPGNSRLVMARLKSDFGIETPHWRDGLSHVLDEIYA
jgi:dTDP-4-dehydrorhamnose reductase